MHRMLMWSGRQCLCDVQESGIHFSQKSIVNWISSKECVPRRCPALYMHTLYSTHAWYTLWFLNCTCPYMPTFRPFSGLVKIAHHLISRTTRMISLLSCMYTGTSSVLCLVSPESASLFYFLRSRGQSKVGQNSSFNSLSIPD